MSKFTYTPISDEEAARIERETLESDKTEPRVVAARCDAERLVMEMRGGATVTIPTRLLPELANASDVQRSAVSIQESGAALEWDELDVQMTVPAVLILALGVFPMSGDGRGGTAKAARSASALRANGRRGGRPRKRDRAREGAATLV